MTKNYHSWFTNLCSGLKAYNLGEIFNIMLNHTLDNEMSDTTTGVKKYRQHVGHLSDVQ